MAYAAAKPVVFATTQNEDGSWETKLYDTDEEVPGAENMENLEALIVNGYLKEVTQ